MERVCRVELTHMDGKNICVSTVFASCRSMILRNYEFSHFYLCVENMCVDVIRTSYTTVIIINDLCLYSVDIVF